MLGFSINPIEATSGLDETVLNIYSTKLEEMLAVIGEDTSHNTLLMSPTGRVYAAFDKWVYLIGESGEEAIETMCTQKSGQQVLLDWHRPQS